MAEVKREYYNSGELRSEVFEINGKKEGEYKTYYENGHQRVHLVLPAVRRR
jgi:antitoxin component YwqK of YwqJK toxin-antitoxin module